MACGAGLFFVATLGAVLTVGILKISEVITSLRKKVWTERTNRLFVFAFFCYICFVLSGDKFLFPRRKNHK